MYLQELEVGGEKYYLQDKIEEMDLEQFGIGKILAARVYEPALSGSVDTSALINYENVKKELKELKEDTPEYKEKKKKLKELEPEANKATMRMTSEMVKKGSEINIDNQILALFYLNEGEKEFNRKTYDERVEKFKKIKVSTLKKCEELKNDFFIYMQPIIMSGGIPTTSAVKPETKESKDTQTNTE